MRSAALGSNLYANANPRGKPAPADEAGGSNTHAMEREHLVRTLATILRSNAPTTSLRPKDTGSSPSSTVNTAAAVTREGRGCIAATAHTLGLAEALVSFLPPAREEGLQGVTRESVALRPIWSAAPALTANVGGCLLHLMDGECAGQITEQVMAGVLLLLLSASVLVFAVEDNRTSGGWCTSATYYFYFCFSFCS